MALNRLKSGYISNTTHDGGNAANAAVIGYSTANNRVEFIEATVDTSALDTISANVSNYSTQLTANINTVAANADVLVVGVDAAEASLDGVSDNIDSFATYANSTFVSDGIAANTFVTIETNTLTEEGFTGNVTANVSSDLLTFTAGNGVAFLANASAQSITLAAKLSEIAHDRFTADGTANTFTLSREADAADELIVYVDGVLQVPANNYTVSSTTLTLANVLPLINGTLVDVRHLPVSGSEGELEIVGPPHAQGSTSGYYTGGITGNSARSTIEKIPFSSDTSSTDVAELTLARGLTSGHSSSTHGYVTGGAERQPYSPGWYDTIDKYPFSSDANATDVGDLVSARAKHAGHSSETDGYVVGGQGSDDSGAILEQIEKFSFASDSDASNIGTVTLSFVLNEGKGHPGGGNSSATHGYTAGGYENYNGGPSPLIDIIEKFSFATDGNATDVGEISQARMGLAGADSATHGYVAGGQTGGSPIVYIGTIEKFPFSSDTSSTDVGELIGSGADGAGASATEAGFFGKAVNDGNGYGENIQKVPFSSDTSSVDVGELQNQVKDISASQV